MSRYFHYRSSQFNNRVPRHEALAEVHEFSLQSPCIFNCLCHGSGSLGWCFGWGWVYWVTSEKHGELQSNECQVMLVKWLIWLKILVTNNGCLYCVRQRRDVHWLWALSAIIDSLLVLPHLGGCFQGGDLAGHVLCASRGDVKPQHEMYI